ncbi:hypothetical protein [Streptomyces litchfieldiae]|uniref:Uncharacterized protein n=1 Tax=Streptomyces litchfieldiae TaxID=3075543 RepID=A0ABU2MSN2_9ACTN|nr:hypothetical protein [Streptomyces sp. DSM 44938]MDT0344397.1 hypothetical protein [Streptomyces sp. DSM 44938]
MLKVDHAAARERIAELTAARLVRETPDGAVEATERGKAEWSRIRAGITRITHQLWGDLPEHDLATAGSVLNTVLARANALLAARPPEFTAVAGESRLSTVRGRGAERPGRGWRGRP